MRRCTTVFFLIMAISFALTLTACLGKNTPNPGGQAVSSVTLSPNANFSLDVGGTAMQRPLFRTIRAGDLKEPLRVANTGEDEVKAVVTVAGAPLTPVSRGHILAQNRGAPELLHWCRDMGGTNRCADRAKTIAPKQSGDT